MLTFDDRLTFVNQMDQRVFSGGIKEDAKRYRKAGAKLEAVGEETKQQLPIVLHEREIMENIENFMVTIVCGETGSGKSTQIPQFIH